jgi:hypothetical protein
MVCAPIANELTSSPALLGSDADATEEDKFELSSDKAVRSFGSIWIFRVDLE